MSKAQMQSRTCQISLVVLLAVTLYALVLRRRLAQRTCPSVSQQSLPSSSSCISVKDEDGTISLSSPVSLLRGKRYTLPDGTNSQQQKVLAVDRIVVNNFDTDITSSPGLPAVTEAYGNTFLSAFVSSYGGVAVQNIWGYDGQTFFALGDGLNTPASVIIPGPENTIFVGGSFTSSGAQTLNRLAQYNIQTQTWTEIGGGIPDGFVSDLLYDAANQRLWVVGSFQNVNAAAPVACNSIAVRRLDTNVWITHASTVGAISTLTNTPGNPNQVFFGGQFGAVTNVSANISRASTDGTTITFTALTAVPAVNGGVNKLLTFNNRVYVGGSFGSITGGSAVGKLAFLQSPTFDTWTETSSPALSSGGFFVQDMFVFAGQLMVFGQLSSNQLQIRSCAIADPNTLVLRRSITSENTVIRAFSSLGNFWIGGFIQQLQGVITGRVGAVQYVEIDGKFLQGSVQYNKILLTNQEQQAILSWNGSRWVLPTYFNGLGFA